MIKEFRNPIVIILSLMFVVIVFFQVISIINNKSDNVHNPIVLTPKAQLQKVSIDEVNISYAPEVPKSAQRDDQRIFDVYLEVIEGVCDIDPKNNTKFDVWGYRIKGDDNVVCGAPGPVLRGRVGDIARITLTNLEDNKHPHNIDFHSVTGQGGGAKDLAVAPGETATIEVRLLYPGAFMYHCATSDVPTHIAHGMYGMFIVDPEIPLPEADHEWAIMQSEWYLTDPDENGVSKLDHDTLINEEPSLITFNGKTDALSGDNSLTMQTEERGRIYFVNEGLNLASNFHAIGSHWDVVYPEGATDPANRIIYGSQSTLVVAGGGTVTELVAKVPSTIILVDHALIRTFYKGAIGLIKVLGMENPEIFEVKESEEEKVKTTEKIINNDVEADVRILKGSAGYDSNKLNDYSPYEFTVSVGDTVTWINDDAIAHTVTANDDSFDSGMLKKGESWSHTFTEPGTYEYYCAPHPWMKGKVIVI